MKTTWTVIIRFIIEDEWRIFSFDNYDDEDDSSVQRELLSEADMGKIEL